MAYTLDQLQALQNAFALGLTRVSYQGRSFDYASSADLLKAIEVITASLNKTNGVVSDRQIRVWTTKGLGC